MKQKSTNYKIYAIFIALALLFLFGVNVTYSYFTAQKAVAGTGNMGELVVCWFGADSTGSERSYFEDDDGPIDEFVVTPSNGTIARGESFTGFSYTDVANDSYSNHTLGLYTSQLSTSAYIRVWVEAYVVLNGENQTSVNYGQYFELQINDQTAVSSALKTDSENNETNRIYYLNSALATNEEISFITGMKLLDTAPIEMLDGTLELTLHFDAVQASNEAFKAKFNDWKGYLSSWT